MDQPRNSMRVSMDRLPVKKPMPKRPTKRQKAMRVLVIAFCALVVALIGCGILIYANISKMWGGLGFDENAQLDIIESGNADELAGLPELTFSGGEVSGISKLSGETDILLIGVDNRAEEFAGHSDVMMYLRVNAEKKTIKLASFMRDTLVKIDGHGTNRLNTAYYYGSKDLAYQTYHDSFGLRPDYYMVVNFYGMEDIIDSLDGVDISVEKGEMEWLNINISEINTEDPGGKVANIEKSGDLRLNGRQAVAYMRIRKPGGDSARIERQQKVLKQLFNEMRNISIGEIPGILSVLGRYVRTDLPAGTMIDLASAVQGMSADNLKTFRYPDSYVYGTFQDKDVVQAEDFDTEYGKLNDFLEN